MSQSSATRGTRRYLTAQAAVADQLREEILSGQLAAGSRVLQAQVAERMQMSTTPVREAIRELASEGLLTTDPHRGVIVKEPKDAELAEIYELRLVLEGLSIRKTVENATDEQLAIAEQVLTEMEATDDLGAWVVLNAEFHKLLAQFSNSPTLAEFLVNLRNRASLYVAVSLRGDGEHFAQANGEHRAILEACRARDADRAVQIVNEHLNATVDRGHRTLEADHVAT
jgi:DNA-binding GntR family transcriptional regulator